MCILFLYIGDGKTLPTLIASNRDEHFVRPTQRGQLYPVPSSSGASSESTDRQEAPANGTQWRYIPYDQEGGGTWLSFQHEAGKGLRFAVVLNYHLFRDEASTQTNINEAALLTRGKLVLDFMNNVDKKTLSDYANDIFAQRGRYRPFNLILFDESAATDSKDPQQPSPTCYYVSSSQYQSAPRALYPGTLYGITNGCMDVEWQKVTVGKSLLLQAVMEKLADAASEELVSTGNPNNANENEENKSFYVLQNAKTLPDSTQFEKVSEVVQGMLAVLNHSQPLPDPTFSAPPHCNEAPDTLSALEQLAAIHVSPTVILPGDTFLHNGQLNPQKYQTLSHFRQSADNSGYTDKYVFGTRTSTALLYHSVPNEEEAKFVIVEKDWSFNGQHSVEGGATQEPQRCRPDDSEGSSGDETQVICSINVFSNLYQYH